MDVKDRWAVWPEAFGSDLEPGFQKMKDVLDGLTVYYQNPFIYDIRNTVLSFPDSNLDVALNKKQTACKKWLVDELYRAAGPRIKRIHVLAGWYGVLAAFLLNDPRFKIKKITSIDRDPSCREIALSLNRTHLLGAMEVISERQGNNLSFYLEGTPIIGPLFQKHITLR